MPASGGSGEDGGKQFYFVSSAVAAATQKTTLADCARREPRSVSADLRAAITAGKMESADSDDRGPRLHVAARRRKLWTVGSAARSAGKVAALDRQRIDRDAAMRPQRQRAARRWPADASDSRTHAGSDIRAQALAVADTGPVRHADRCPRGLPAISTAPAARFADRERSQRAILIRRARSGARSPKIIATMWSAPSRDMESVTSTRSGPRRFPNQRALGDPLAATAEHDK